jgi:hypothetical protein
MHISINPWTRRRRVDLQDAYTHYEDIGLQKPPCTLRKETTSLFTMRYTLITSKPMVRSGACVGRSDDLKKSNNFQASCKKLGWTSWSVKCEPLLHEVPIEAPSLWKTNIHNPSTHDLGMSNVPPQMGHCGVKLSMCNVLLASERGTRACLHAVAHSHNPCPTLITIIEPSTHL